MSEETIRRQERGAETGISVWSEFDGRYLVACPDHPDTPAVDCIVCEPVDTAEATPTTAIDPWLHPAPWAPAAVVLTDEAVDRIAEELFMVTAAEALHAESGRGGPAFTAVQFRTDSVRPAVRTALENAFTPAREERPEDDPAPRPTCNGANCGGNPHD